MYRANLTKRQYQILEFIYEKTNHGGNPPTLREIGEEFSISSTKGVSDHLRALEKKGWITRKKGQARGIRIEMDKVGHLLGKNYQVPIVGQVTAGEPTLAVENIEGILDLNEMFGNRGDLFALQVKGNSMVEAGIHKGDLLVIRRQSRAEPGDIVVAIIEDQEGTVKRLSKIGDKIHLEPANPEYEEIVKPASQVEIRGLVVGVVRKV
ncbi:MAG: transcriptional repressor LexA [Candidatus Acetothermia bacterium]